MGLLSSIRTCILLPFTRGKTVFVRCFLFQPSDMTNPTIFWTLLRSNAYEFVQDFVLFLSGRYRLSTHMLIFVVNIRPARTFWNSTHCLIFTMVSYFLRWTLLKFFSSILDEQSQQKVRRLGRITHAVINTSNDVKCPLLWQFELIIFLGEF